MSEGLRIGLEEGYRGVVPVDLSDGRIGDGMFALVRLEAALAIVPVSEFVYEADAGGTVTGARPSSGALGESQDLQFRRRRDEGYDRSAQEVGSAAA